VAAAGEPINVAPAARGKKEALFTLALVAEDG
jgi:hypothetical protein